MKRDKPGKGPPAPGHVDLGAIMLASHDLSMKGISTPEMEYIRAHAPAQSMDKWGQPLPLSLVDQGRLDRVFSLLVAPLARGRALLESGRLTPDEVDALAATNPDVLQALVQQAMTEMIDHPAPYAPWAEAVLGFLFQRPAAKFLADQQAGGKGAQAGDVAAPPTPVDRLDPAVRQLHARR